MSDSERLLREKVGRFIAALGKHRSIESITKETWAGEFWDMCEAYTGGPLTTARFTLLKEETP